MPNIHHSVCSVIPQYVLRGIAERDDGRTGRIALATLDQLHDLQAQTKRPAISGLAQKSRNIYDAQNRQALPGRLVMSEHRRRGDDTDVNDAYDAAGIVYDFYSAIFGRKSLDGRNTPIDSTVHYGEGFDNAAWNGRQMIYGDGGGKLFTRFTACLDLVAHGLTHGMTQTTADLGFHGQRGAVNEHISDAFTIMIKQFSLGQKANESNWLIGEGIFGPDVSGTALRSMATPGHAYDDPILGRDPQPAHMRNFNIARGDSGGVHINSGILNHAFYLAATALGGYTWELLGRVWYVTVKERLTPNIDFQTFAATTVKVAGRLFGRGGHIGRTIADAWRSVGLKVARSRKSSNTVLHAPEIDSDRRRFGVRWLR
jgi:Zn-dependent metalloprotease